MPNFHHRKLPEYSSNPDQPTPPTILSGHSPPTELGFQSDQLQIIYNFKNHNWVGDGEKPHCHIESDEAFIVLNGSLTVEVEVEVEGEIFEIGPREFCCFPKGVFHAVLKVHPPIEALVIRAPSVLDKVYLE